MEFYADDCCICRKGIIRGSRHWVMTTEKRRPTDGEFGALNGTEARICKDCFMVERLTMVEQPPPADQGGPEAMEREVCAVVAKAERMKSLNADQGDGGQEV